MNSQMTLIALLLVAVSAVARAASTVDRAAILDECFCTKEYNPVCGNNGKTFGNECELNCQRQQGMEGLRKVYDGECKAMEPEPCVCNKMYAPVCGNNGKTYANECVMQCQQRQDAGLAKVYDGECKVNALSLDSVPCACPRNYAPVCGTNGVTYANECTLRCAQRINHELEKVADGECTPAAATCMCPRNYAPVCGTDGKTYANECSLNCQQAVIGVRKVHDGECKPATAPCMCPRNFAPVCGTDGQTYANECALNCQQAVTGVRKVHDGECINMIQARSLPVMEKKCVCPMNYAPVCASNGMTFPNECAMNCDNQGLRKVHNGACEEQQEEDICICTMEYAPVCGSTGRTFPNQCALECQVKKNQRNKILGLYKLYDGECGTGKPVWEQ